MLRASTCDPRPEYPHCIAVILFEKRKEFFDDLHVSSAESAGRTVTVHIALSGVVVNGVGCTKRLKSAVYDPSPKEKFAELISPKKVEKDIYTIKAAKKQQVNSRRAFENF